MYKEIIDFWFEELKPAQWWKKDEKFDRLIEERFGKVHRAAVQGELFGWRVSGLGRLAEIIVLDQFSRNIYRDQVEAFSADTAALILSQETVAAGLDAELSPTQRTFLYMPYMHSESLKVHNQAVELYRRNGIEDNYNFELKHREIIERFGRYPHRNSILGRISTDEEKDFLQQPGSSF